MQYGNRYQKKNEGGETDEDTYNSGESHGSPLQLLRPYGKKRKTIHSGGIRAMENAESVCIEDVCFVRLKE